MKIERNGSSITLFAEGRIDTNAAPQFAAEMEEVLKDAEELTLDFSGLEYISSSGLRTVMLAVKTMRRRGSMQIVNVREDIYSVLETTGFTGVCDVELKE